MNVKKTHTVNLKSAVTAVIAGVLLNIPYGAIAATQNTALSGTHFSQTAPLKQAAQFYSVKVGDATVTSISDGTFPMKASVMLRGEDDKTIQQKLNKAFLTDDLETSLNVYLIKMNNRFILVDAGYGKMAGNGISGRLLENLKAMNVKPSDITDILVTHAHGDHTGGLVDDGHRVFTNATLYIGKPDVDFFLDPKEAAHSDYKPAALPHAFEEAVSTVKPYVDAGKVVAFDKTTEVLPGITASIHPGHTPGSAFYTLESKGETIVFIGDTVHVEALQFADPKITMAVDVNQKDAANNRRVTFKELATKGYLVAAPHVQYPGLGHITVNDNVYSWIAEPFRDREVK